MNVRANLVILGFLAVAALCACGSRSSADGSSTLPRGPGSDAGSRSATRTYSLTGAPRSYAFAPVGGFSGSIVLRGATVPAQTSLQLVTTLAAPANAPLLQRMERPLQSTGTFDVYFYTTIRLSNTVTFPAPPGFSVTLPATIDPAGLAFYYAVSNPTPTNGAIEHYRTEGPATVSGQSVTFAPSITPLTFFADENYTIALYAVTAGAAHIGAGKST